ncbi:MAG: hypothetical protein NVS2B14_00340 [Chamaesiphon sp.]
MQYPSTLEAIPSIGFVRFRHGLDKQTTIYEIAIDSPHRGLGWGRLLFYRVLCSAIEKGQTSIIAKCPHFWTDLKTNQFYQRLGFTLIKVEGRKPRLNVWRYAIAVPLLFYCADGGDSPYTSVAKQEGWLTGFRSDKKNKNRQGHAHMIDNHWTKYDHAKHLEEVKKHKPLIATARDIEQPDQLPEILEQAQELGRYAGRVILIPKCKVDLPPTAWLGLSIPTGYASASESLRYWFGLPCGQYAGTVNPTIYASHPTHLLGGSPKAQAQFAKHLPNVVSLDGNYAMRIAKFGKSCWQGFQGKRVSGCYESFRLSLRNQKDYWHNPKLPWSWEDEPLARIGQ